MRIGYARVSTADQNPDLQEDALQKAGGEKIFRDVASGAVDSRRGLAEAIDYARDGDTLVVWKLDRLGRSLKHLIETVNGLAARNRQVGPGARDPEADQRPGPAEDRSERRAANDPEDARSTPCVRRSAVGRNDA
jgi:hypothetical protein